MKEFDLHVHGVSGSIESLCYKAIPVPLVAQINDLASDYVANFPLHVVSYYLYPFLSRDHAVRQVRKVGHVAEHNRVLQGVAFEVMVAIALIVQVALLPIIVAERAWSHGALGLHGAGHGAEAAAGRGFGCMNCMQRRTLGLAGHCAPHICFDIAASDP